MKTGKIGAAFAVCVLGASLATARGDEPPPPAPDWAFDECPSGFLGMFHSLAVKKYQMTWAAWMEEPRKLPTLRELAKELERLGPPDWHPSISYQRVRVCGPILPL